MREDCMTGKRPEIFNPRPPRVSHNHEQDTSMSRKTKTRSQGIRSSKRQALKAEEKAQEGEEDDDDDYEDEEEDEEEENEENEEEDEDEEDKKEEEEEEDVMIHTDDLTDNPYYAEDYPYMFRTEQDFALKYDDVPVATTRRPTLAMEFTHDTSSRNGRTLHSASSSSPSAGTVSLAEHERVILEMRVNMKRMERIIEIQADQIERLEDTAADYIVFRDRLASLFGTGRGE
ncbi:hypothetical protein BGZ92_007205 [Podila epicladia]|nr:hypothetical protein BGZ92_007205 [Podila epicladia]